MKVRVGIPYMLVCITDDKWGRSYVHPYEIEGFVGYIAKSTWEELERFKNFKPSLASIQEVTFAQRLCASIGASECTQKLPITTAEILAAMGPAKSLIRQVDVESAETPEVYYRSYVAFADPKVGLQRVSWFSWKVMPALLRIYGAFLNAIGWWKHQGPPTMEQLLAADDIYFQQWEER